MATFLADKSNLNQTIISGINQNTKQLNEIIDLAIMKSVTPFGDIADHTKRVVEDRSTTYM